MARHFPFYSLDEIELRNLLYGPIVNPDNNVHLDSVSVALQNYIELNFNGLPLNSAVFKNLSINEFNSECSPASNKYRLLVNGISLLHIKVRRLNANLEEFCYL